MTFLRWLSRTQQQTLIRQQQSVMLHCCCFLNLKLILKGRGNYSNISPNFLSLTLNKVSVSPLCGWWLLTEQADVLCVFIWLKSLFIEWMNGICCADRVTKGLHLIAYTRNQIRFQMSELLSWQDEILWSINHHFYINILEKTCHPHWQTECY